MKNTFKMWAVAATMAVMTAGASSAATVSYSNAEPTPQIDLVIDDAVTPGKFRFSLSTAVGTADYLALAFNFGGASVAQSDISLISATRANGTASTPSLELFGNNTGSQNACGSGCNFNGSGSPTLFDYIIRIGEQGGGGPGGINYVKSVVFEIMTPGSLVDNPFSQLAVRAQDTTNPGGSIKTSLTPDTTPVPLPAAGWMLLAGLGGMAAMRRRKKA